MDWFEKNTGLPLVRTMKMVGTPWPEMEIKTLLESDAMIGSRINTQPLKPFWYHDQKCHNKQIGVFLDSFDSFQPFEIYESLKWIF